MAFLGVDILLLEIHDVSHDIPSQNWNALTAHLEKVENLYFGKEEKNSWKPWRTSDIFKS